MPPASQRDPVLLDALACVPAGFFHERLFGAMGVGAAVRQETRAAYPPEMLEEADRLGTGCLGATAGGWCSR